MLVVIIGFILGGFIGSFLGVIVHRLPQGKSIVTPPSHCDVCGTVLRWYDNVPLIGWLLLRGRCRWCATPIPWSVAAVEWLTAATTALILWWAFAMPEAVVSPLGLAAAQWLNWPALAPLLATVALLLAAWSLIVSTLTDLAHLIIPDEISKPLQLLAPFLALLMLGSLGEAEYLIWFFTTSSPLEGGDQGGKLAMWTVGSGAIVIAGIVLLTLVALIASLPFARWVYGTRLRGPFPWREDDHRAFALGLWWYAGSLLPAVVLLLLLAAVVDVSEGIPLSLYLVLGLSHALLGSLCGWLLPYAVGLFGSWGFGRNAMGYGDVKMLAWMGALLGPLGVLYTFFLAAIYGSLVGIPMRLLGGSREIPFGPYLVLGGVSAFIWGADLSRWLWQHLAV